MGKRGSITLCGQEELQNLKRALYNLPTLLFWLLILYSGNSWEEIVPFWGQLCSLSRLPYQGVWTRRKWRRQSQTSFESIFDKKESLNSEQYQIPVNCRDCSKPAEYLTTSPLLNCFATKGTPLPDWKSSRNISQKYNRLVSWPTELATHRLNKC